MRGPTALTIAALVASPLQPLAGQRSGTLEIGGFGRFTRFDRSLQLDNVFGGGAYLSLFAVRAFALEVAGAYIPTTGPAGADSVVVPLYARLVFGVPIGDEVALLVGGGYLHTFYGTTGKFADDGVNGLIGVRFGLSETLTFRLAATADFVPSPSMPSTSIPNYWNFALEAGLSAGLGSSRPKDGDRDADDDSVIDALDRCPHTQPGEKVDAQGCVLPEDADQDGVFDHHDRCRDTPRGEGVDATGCPLDSDRDSVPNASDKCPLTAAGGRVDATGCPGLFPDTQRVLVLEGVTFDAGSTTLTASARRALDQVAVRLEADPGTRVEVAGHTDERGREAENLGLSWSRAEAVRRYLIERGVPAEQVTARGFGAFQPIDTTVTAGGSARNRRIELRRIH